MTAIRDTSWIKRSYADLAYASLSAAQALDLYLPNDTPAPYPCIVAIHGGGFIFGDKREDQLNAPVEAVRQGYAVAAVNYRMAGEALFPAPVQDVKAAIRFLRAHAREFDIDPARFASWGNSAGGYLAVMAGVTGGISDGVSEFDDPALGNAAQPSDVQAVIDWFGPVDFRTQDAELRASGKGRPVHDAPDSPESSLLGVPLPQAGGVLLRRTNPLTYVRPGLPPFLIQHGADDDLVPVEQSLLLAQALRRVLPERDVRLDILPGSLHGGPAFETPENMARVFAFLSATLSVPLAPSGETALTQAR